MREVFVESTAQIVLFKEHYTHETIVVTMQADRMLETTPRNTSSKDHARMGKRVYSLPRMFITVDTSQ
jgi:hypothetical protein